MLKKNAQLFEGLFTSADLFVVSVAWIVSYWIRFASGWIPIEKGIPPLADYLKVLIFVWAIWAFVFRRFDLYRGMRGMNRLRELFQVVRANSFAVLIFLAMTYLFREKSVPFSRLVFLIFWAISTIGLLGLRFAVRQMLRTMRKRGFNLRHVLVVGAGELSAKVVGRMRRHPEFGVVLMGCLSGDYSPTAGPHIRRVSATPEQMTFPMREAVVSRPAPLASVQGNTVRSNTVQFLPQPVQRLMVRPEGEHAVALKVIGHYRDLRTLIDSGRVDMVIVALPLADQDLLPQMIELIGDSIVDVKIVPDYHRFIRLGSLVEEFDGLPVMSLATTPLVGMNRVLKRLLDLLLGTILFLCAAPIIAFAALVTKLTSRGPVFYSQERVGLDGQRFQIYKIRTMQVDADQPGAGFTVKGDPRVTRFGGILRKLSIDELPQLLNVVRGQMSLVGPRPERPVYIEDFRKQIPRYMLRHKVQAGMTGWAQVHGWRGNTSIERRIEHDLYYIEHWSLGLDLKILFMTLFHTFRGRNAY